MLPRLKLIYKTYLHISCIGFAGACLFFIFISLKSGSLEITFNAFTLVLIWPLAGIIGLSSYILYSFGVRNMMLLGPMASIGIIAAIPLFLILLLGDGLYIVFAVSLAMLIFEAIRVMFYEAYLDYKKPN